MLTQFSDSIADAVAAAALSVVQVHGVRAPASGLVYGDGIVLTTVRAVGREDGIQVRRDDGQVADAEMAGWDPATGLAVLRVSTLDAPALVPSTATVRVGHFAVAVARSWSNAVTASVGIVAVIGGPLRTGRRRTIEQIFRTTAPMHDGFSGGAFLDASGKLIGVTTASTIRGLGVVIPAGIAWKAAGIVLDHGHLKRGYLGIAGQPAALAPQQQSTAGRDRGLVVVSLVPDGPADRGGLLVGDVVLAIDETSVDGPEQLMDLLMSVRAGQTIKVKVLRGDKLAEIALTAGERHAK